MNIALSNSKNTSATALLLAASVLLSLAQSALSQTIVTLTINSQAGGFGSWNFPINVELPIGGGLTHAAWYGAFGDLETGTPVFSDEVDPAATFYHATTVNGFPIPQGCDCYCPDLADETSIDSSYVAILPVTNGPPLVWISACEKGQCTTGGPLDSWYWQIRYFSGNPSQNQPATLQIGSIPDDEVWNYVSTFGGFNVAGLPGPPDLSAVSFNGDYNKSGADFKYQNQGGALPVATTAQLYWATGTTTNDIIFEDTNSSVPVIFSQAIPPDFSGSSGLINVPGSYFQNPPTNATYVLLVLDYNNALPAADKNNTVIALSLVDLAIDYLAWDSQGGLNFSYYVTNGALTNATTAGLFWATGTTTNSIISTEPVIFSQQIAAGGPYQSVLINVPASDFANPPTGASYVLLVLDPNDLVPELNKTNNVQALQYCAPLTATLFLQAATGGGVPATYNGSCSTQGTGCALCAAAMMLTSFPGGSEVTPAKLDVAMKNVGGYSGCGLKDFDIVPTASAQLNNLTPLCQWVEGPINSDSTISAYLTDHFCGQGQHVIVQLTHTKTWPDPCNNNQSTTVSGSHFILVTTNLNGDWGVMDPGWKVGGSATAPAGQDIATILTTLNGHIGNNVFYTTGLKCNGTSYPDVITQHSFHVAGVRTFAQGPPAVPALAGSGDCPIELLITDPLGRRLGYDSSTGQDVSEIPGGSYYREFPVIADDDGDDELAGETNGIKNFYISAPIPGSYSITEVGTGSGAYTLTLETLTSGTIAQTTSYTNTAAEGVSFTNNFVFTIPPQITTQPMNQSVFPGGRAVFSVAASGPGPLYYQWQFDGTNLAGATDAVLTVTNVQDWNVGSYQVAVTNGGGTITSAPASLTILSNTVPPTLAAIANQFVGYLTTLNVTASATDPGVPPETFSFSLVTAPTNMTINPTTGQINWTPLQTQCPSTNTVVVQATVSGTPPLSATTHFTVVVGLPNVVPIPAIIGQQNVNELTQLTVVDTATESNTNATLSYSLLNAPAGMTINTNTGVITWTPSQAQSPNAGVDIMVIATSTDPFDPVNPRLSATNGFYVVVQEVNVVPVLPPLIANQTVNALTQLTVINTATDSDIHASLSYRLIAPPAGATIDDNGIITWIPSLAQAASTNVITTVVTGSDSYASVNANLTATNSFTVVVKAPQNTYTWTNSLGGDWRETNNWSPNGMPEAADNAYIPNIGSGPTVMVYVNASVGGLTFGGTSGSFGPTLAGPAALTVTGPLSWKGGTISNMVVQCNGGALSGSCFLDGGQLINTGTLAWDYATLYDGANSVISNAPGATINLSANGQVTAAYWGAGGAFHNAGQINVTNSVTIDDSFINTGTVTVNSGALDLQGGGMNYSNITVAANATLEFSANSGIFTCTGGSDVSDAGNLLVSAEGTVDLAGTVSVAGTNNFSSGIVNVTGSYPITTPLVISGATVNLNGIAALTPPVLTMSNGTLSNSTPLMASQLNWSGGTICGVVQCNGGTVSGEEVRIGEVFIGGGELINTGTLAWNVSGLVDGESSVISNAPGAVIDMTVNPKYSPIAFLGSGGANYSGTFYNAGQLNVSPGTNQNQIEFNDTFVNMGKVNVNSGLFTLLGGGINYSNIVVTAPNATLEFSLEGNPGAPGFTCTSGSELSDAGNLWFEGGSNNILGTVTVGGTNIFGSSEPVVNVTGDYPITGPMVISGGTVNLNGTGALTPPVLTMSGGTLSNTVPVVAGQLNWSAGSILSTVQCNGGTVSGEQVALGEQVINDATVIGGGELINTGTLAWNVFDVLDGSGSVISNAPGGIINMTVNTKFGTACSVGGGLESFSGTFYNGGQLNLSPGTNQINFIDTFVNTGNVSVNSGTLSLQKGGTNYNQITVATNAWLELRLAYLWDGSMVWCSYPTFTCTSGSFLNDSGNLVFGGAWTNGPYIDAGCGAYTFNLGGTVTVAGATIVNGSYYPTTVNVTGDYPLTNALAIFGASALVALDGTGPLTPTMVTMSGGTLTDNAPLVTGYLNWSGGTIQGVVQCNGGTLSNTCYLQGGQLVNTGTLAWAKATLEDGGGSVVSNAPGATINLTASGVVTTHSYLGTATFYNSGQLNVSAGPSPASLADTVINTGTLSVNSGTLAPGAVYLQTAGLTLLNGGNINNSLPLLIQGGTLAGSGVISGSVTNNGIVSPGTPFGSMTINGNYVQTGLGTLNIELGGTVPGTSFDLLAITSKATLAGTLNVGFTNGYYPASTNASFTFLNASPLTGAFGNFSYPFNKVGMRLNYTTNSATIQVTNLGPVIGPLRLTAPTYVDGQFTMQIGITTGPYYIIETSTNLIQWTALLTNTTPATPYQFVDYLAGIFGTRFYRVQQAP